MHDDETVTSTELSRELPADARVAAPPPNLRTREPERYEVVAEHGRGGLGRVLRARDRELGRDVAIKEVLACTPATEARFVREAMITARLEHPGIVPVHDAGRWPDGTPFYAMKLVSGRPLKQLIQDATTAAARLALLPHVIAVADAIAYAHDRGIVHRDLKPSNIIVGEFGETVVIDWGLAKDARVPEPDAAEDSPPDDPGLTRTGAVLGTPSYMAPEQARGQAVDERADVYALGAVLYHVLGGAPPYGGSRTDVLTRVLTELPAPLESIAPHVPAELVTIVRKAMAREAADRYPDARALAEDLRRFHTGQLVGAHDYSRRALIARWLRRHRVPVAIATVALVTLAIVATVSVRGVLASRREAVNRANELILTQARNNLDRDPTATIAWLKAYPDDGKDVQEAHWIAADAVSRGVARRVLRGHHGSVTDAAVLADGTAVTVATDDAIRFWDVETETQVLELPAHVNIYHNLQISRDGRRVSYRESMQTTVVVDIADRRPRRFDDCGHPPLATWFSSNGKRIACTDAHSRVRIVDVDTNTASPIDGLGPVESINAMAISEAGTLLAVGYVDGGIKVARLDEGSTLELSGRGPDVPMSMQLSDDSKMLVVSSLSGAIDLWRIDERRSERLVQHSASPWRSIAISRNGRDIAFVTGDGSVAWRSSDFEPVRTLPIDGREIGPMEFSSDGQMLAVGYRTVGQANQPVLVASRPFRGNRPCQIRSRWREPHHCKYG
jgi:eukaryotic-like serine/threonine-protein kinase